MLSLCDDSRAFVCLVFVTEIDRRFPQRLDIPTLRFLSPKRRRLLDFKNVMDVVRGASSFRPFVFVFVVFGIAAGRPFSSASFSLSVV
jgi:hypothetical protein